MVLLNILLLANKANEATYPDYNTMIPAKATSLSLSASFFLFCFHQSNTTGRPKYHNFCHTGRLLLKFLFWQKIIFFTSRKATQHRLKCDALLPAKATFLSLSLSLSTSMTTRPQYTKIPTLLPHRLIVSNNLFWQRSSFYFQKKRQHRLKHNALFPAKTTFLSLSLYFLLLQLEDHNTPQYPHFCHTGWLFLIFNSGKRSSFCFQKSNTTEKEK